LILFLLSVVLAYLLANKFCERLGWKVGALTAVLMLTSPLMLRFASENMIESLGMLLFLSATYMYLVCEEHREVLYYVTLAFILGLSLYTNYVYAFLMLPSFLVVTLVKLGPLTLAARRLSKKGEKVAVPFIWWAYKKLIVLGVLLVLAAGWFSFNFSRRVALLLDVILRSGMGQGPGWLESLVYYPRVIVEQISFSPWIGIFLLLSLFVPFVARHFEGLKKLYVFVWTVLLLATLIISTKAPQIIYIIVPFIFMIFSAVFFHWLERFWRRDKKLAWLLVLVLMLPSLISLPRIYGLYLPERTGQNMVDVLDYFKTNVPEAARFGTILNLKHFNPDVLRFHFRDRPGRILSEETLERGGLSGESVYYLTFDLDADSRYKKDLLDDSLYRWNAWLREKEINGKVGLHSSERFENIDLTARIYKNIP
ncbi:MAG: glycosyltransferase family 39 protein, partial [Candidatus Margulisbacteria bacterium]|nr:glycosyltransferase family 39 protein [Candidatus Margulisiibacteriota bacterium]